MTDVPLAAVVQLTSTSDVEANWQSASSLIRQAAARGAALVATPENTNYLGPHDEKVRRAEPTTGPTCRRFGELARELRLHLLLGSFNEASDEAARCYNTSVLFGPGSPDGAVLASYRKADPDAPRVVVGDISFRGGGPMDEHVSHQNGLDVDVYYPRRDRALRAPVATGQIDRARAQDLLNLFVAAGAQMVFVGFSTGLHGPGGVVIPYPNHENHMHVRFPPPG